MRQERFIMKSVAIIGYGWVGKAIKKLFPDAYVYTEKIGTRKKVNERDVAFICVPTPSVEFGAIFGRKGQLDTSTVETCISWCECPLIVVRSTVNPGDCDYWMRKYPGKKIVFQPEYLGETPAHPLLDPKERKFLIIGGNPRDRRELIELYTHVYNANITIREVTHTEAEIIKLTENRAIFFKSAQCQELYDVCEESGVNYYTIRDAVYGDDPRFNLWFTFIYPWRRGVVSKCIPKDVYAWCAWAESVGYDPAVTRAMLKKNEEWISKTS